MSVKTTRKYIFVDISVKMFFGRNKIQKSEKEKENGKGKRKKYKKIYAVSEKC